MDFVYHGTDLFPEGSVHHAAEVGSVKAIQQVEEQQKQMRGLPALVVLEQRDELLQCVPLHVAAERGQLEVVQYILRHDVDLDAADGHQVRPLHLAAINNHCDCVTVLIDKGANVTKQDSEGDLPTHWAATKGHVEALEMLLNRGAPVDAHNKAGWTALHRAAYNGRVDAARLLLRRGASIHAVNKSGCTALHLAAANNHLGVIEMLLQLGASTHMKDQQGAIPADMCISDAARSIIQDKEGSQRQAGSSRGSAHVSCSRPNTGVQVDAAKVAAVPADIMHVPHMPRFRPLANNNLDADGFPTAEAQLAASGLHEEASDAGDDMDVAEVLMVEAGQQEDGDEDDGAMSVLSRGLHGPDQGPPSTAGSARFSGPGELSRQSSKQQHTPNTLSNSASFSKASTSSPRQLQPLLSSKSKQTGPMQRFLKQYSLDRKGLFAP